MEPPIISGGDRQVCVRITLLNAVRGGAFFSRTPSYVVLLRRGLGAASLLENVQRRVSLQNGERVTIARLFLVETAQSSPIAGPLRIRRS